MIAALLLQVALVISAPHDEAEQTAAATHTAVAKIRQWREQPPVFVRDAFGVIPDAWQDRVLEEFPRQQQIAGVACKGPGKTALMSWLGWNFLSTRPFPKVPCTSITEKNLRDGLWTEFALWQKKSPFLKAEFEWTAERIFHRQHPDVWWASARNWPKQADPTAQADTLAGIHADYLLFLIDEVSEIPLGVVAAAEAALSSGIETRMVIMGNPTRTDGPLYDAAVKWKGKWFVVHINGDPDDPLRSPRISLKWAREQIEKYGRDSYFVRVNVLGLFPDRAADKLLDVADVNAAMERTVHDSVIAGAPKLIGVDVARFGDDSIQFAPRQGRMMFKLREIPMPGREEPLSILVGDQLIRSIEKWGAQGANVDGSGGYGGGIVDHCRARGYGNMVREVLFGMRAQEHERFENRRSEMYWRLAEWVKTGGGCLPNDPILAAEISAPIYWFDKRGRICLEPKDDIKARIGRSPDKGDAAVLTFADDISASADLDDGQRRVRLPGDDDGPRRVVLPRDGNAWRDS